MYPWVSFPCMAQTMPGWCRRGSAGRELMPGLPGIVPELRGHPGSLWEHILCNKTNWVLLTRKRKTCLLKNTNKVRIFHVPRGNNKSRTLEAINQQNLLNVMVSLEGLVFLCLWLHLKHKPLCCTNNLTSNREWSGHPAQTTDRFLINKSKKLKGAKGQKRYVLYLQPTVFESVSCATCLGRWPKPGKL